jgi:hypothetical protein
MTPEEWAAYGQRILAEVLRHDGELAELRSAIDQLEKACAERADVELVRRRLHELGNTLNHRLGSLTIKLARLEGVGARLRACELAIAKLNVRAGLWGGVVGALAGGATWLLTR